MQEAQYNSKIEKIIATLQHEPKSRAEAAQIQTEIDRLADYVQHIQNSDTNTYKLYQAQAMLSYYAGNYEEAQHFISQAVQMNGHSYNFAEEFLAHLPSSRTSEDTTKWAWFIGLPLPMLIISALLQFIVKFVTSTVEGEGGSSNLLLNITTLSLGLFAIVLALLWPLWITRLVASRHNNLDKGHGLSKRTAVVLAVLTGYWTWLYTKERDNTFFIIGLVCSLLTVGYAFPLIWLWAVIHTISRPESFFSQYQR